MSMIVADPQASWGLNFYRCQCLANPAQWCVCLGI